MSELNTSAAVEPELDICVTAIEPRSPTGTGSRSNESGIMTYSRKEGCGL